MELYKTHGISVMFVAGAILLVLASLLFLNKIVEINLYETYFIISKKTLATGLAIALFFFALVYLVFSRTGQPLNEKFGWIHFLLTVLGGLILICAPIANSAPGDYQTMRQNMVFLSKLSLISFGVFCLGQVILIINIARFYLQK
ncbi:hypothetical protein L0657_23085 [Dyadobacter sp. CY345]|uniref:hypothetical protein n=1 Tax=Dyadobacter sp. CY345 TaxID=2909335 RepID=UPI001F3BBB98|nr:hypothetical protein [Dyadobacter sp. CY345]MCF2446860.1 hypothetical protein [Dyadobacter sp. CY345]